MLLVRLVWGLEKRIAAVSRLRKRLYLLVASNKHLLNDRTPETADSQCSMHAQICSMLLD